MPRGFGGGVQRTGRASFEMPTVGLKINVLPFLIHSLSEEEKKPNSLTSFLTSRITVWYFLNGIFHLYFSL